MNKSSSKLPTSAIVYIALVMFWVVITLLIYPLMTIEDIFNVIRYKCCMLNDSSAMIAGLGLGIGLSLIIPSFRMIYYKFPWLLSFSKINFTNCVILAISTYIINYGFEVINKTRNITFTVLVILQFLICRLAMSYYFYKKPVKSLEE